MLLPDDEEETNYEGYESGPFCVHWSDPGDCDELCLRETCKHPCTSHFIGCEADACECQGLVYEDVNNERRTLE